MLNLLAAAALLHPQQGIEVIGQRLDNRCEKQACSPSDDAEESIRVAQALFLSGDYREARAVIARALKRQRGAEDTHPEAVSALYRSDSNIAAHWGDNEAFAKSGYRGAAIIRNAFGRHDLRSILALIRVGAMESKLGKTRNAARTFGNAAKAARQANMPLLADSLEVRRAWVGAATQPRSSLASLTKMAEDWAVDPKIRVQAAVVAARIARDLEDDEAERHMLAIIASNNRSEEPILVEAPVPLTGRANVRRSSLHEELSRDTAPAVQLSSTPGGSLRWVDVGFWVRPDGSVEEAEILNKAPSASWSNQVVQSIAARRYTPIAAEPGDPGWYRVERFTFRSPYVKDTGSHIKARRGPRVLHQLDITNELVRARAANDPVSVPRN